MSDWETLNSITAYHKLEEAKEKWAKAQEQVIIIDEGKKAILSKCFLRHKLTSKTVMEAENKARTDKEYTDIVKQYSFAEAELIRAKYHYQNLDRFMSFKQTEIKRDVALANKQPM